MAPFKISNQRCYQPGNGL